MQPRRQQGIGLTELMVAVTLGLLIIGAVAQLYLSSRRNQDLEQSLTARQETARFSVQAIENDAYMAGFRGCLRDVGNVVNTLNNPTDFLNNYRLPVSGFEATAGGWSPALPASITNVVAGTDVLTLRTADDPDVFVATAMGNSSASLDMADDVATVPLTAGQIAVVTDCGGAAIFQVTGFTQSTGTIAHAATGTSPGNATADLARRFGVGSQVFTLRTTTYYIANSTNGTGPALWRRVGTNAAQELAEGVENLQVLYGEDTDGNQSPDVYRKASAVADWTNVVSLQVALLVSGTQDRVTEEDPRTFTLLDKDVGPFDDGRVRRVVTFTVALRNRLS